MKKVTAVFDIGKTNKKFFLFDEDYQEVYRDYQRFAETTDEDGYPSGDLQAIQTWVKQLFDNILKARKYEIKAINFSTYGASLVHLDKNGNPLTPLYNYTKPIPKEYLEKFYGKHGNAAQICKKTGSPEAGMLNSGLQLFWLKYAKPEVFEQIHVSLHLPQYISYLFTGIPVSEYTSIGCHTMLWDYGKQDYHQWVYTEKIDKVLPPIVDTSVSINMTYHGRRIKVGVGIHDSSAALLPYLRGDDKSFLLISTGTWSVNLNPFNDQPLTNEELSKNCLNYMRLDGQPIKAARLFLGNEYKIQVELLHKYFNTGESYHRTVKFSEGIYEKVKDLDPQFYFATLDIRREQPQQNSYTGFSNFEEAYHKLMLELMEAQVKSASLAIGDSKIKKVYIDGGFTDNDIFVKLVSYHFRNYKLRTTSSPLGSALGAAMVISDAEIGKKFLKKKYGLKKHKPIILNA